MNKLDVQNAILNAMTPYLDDDQLYQLKNTLIEQLYGMNIVEEETRLSVVVDDNVEYMERFRNEMQVNNMSPKTINQYYRSARNLLEYINKNFRDITYDDVMYYFAMFSKRVGRDGKYISKEPLILKESTVKPILIGVLKMSTLIKIHLRSLKR